MREITKKLSSMFFAVWTVSGLIIWCAFGIVLANTRVFADRFHQMNNTVLINWLVSPQRGSLILKIWFIGLCVIMFILGINLFFCSWTRFYRLIKLKKANLPKYIMFFVHILFGLAAFSHFFGFISGYKYESVRLYCGQSFDFAEGLSAKLINVHYVDFLSSLKLYHREQTLQNFHYHSDYAKIVLLRNGRKLCSSKVYVLKPFRFQSVQITLKRFTPPMQNKHADKDDYADRKIVLENRKPGSNQISPGVVLVISKNPALYVFFIIYPLMILGIGIYLFITAAGLDRV